MNERTLSIIIVNYKTPGLVIDCIRSVYRETTRHTFEVIVVDNDSQDDSREKILSAFPDIRWIQMTYNSGFARGNNAGIRDSHGEWILLLNGDTVILDGALDQVIDLAGEDPGLAACGVQLLNTDGSPQISGARVIRGGTNMLLPLPYLGPFIRAWGYRLKSTIPSISEVSDRVNVDWVIGAFLMVRKSVIEKAGMMDEDFFMYAEEMEWCHRLRKYGHIALFGKPRVIHIGGGTSTSTYQVQQWDNSKTLWTAKARQIMVSGFLRIRKEFGIFWFLFIFGTYVIEIPVFGAGLVIEKLFHGKRSRYQWQHFAGYSRNVFYSFRYFFRFLLNKPYFYKTR